ncbi:MAG: zinc ribbon domain-containing protein [Chloroflexi bacterium]|nr:zinc ribbon domain-containing protein [Chloroflexota bacterium]
MPIYEYRCSKCGHAFEQRRSFKEADAPAACPECQGQAERLLSVFAAKQGVWVRPTLSSAFRKGEEKPAQEGKPSGSPWVTRILE